MKKNEMLPDQPAGSVLFIGLSYYNNEYLAASLRDIGWEAQVLFNFHLGADNFVHDLPKQRMEYCFKPVPRPLPEVFQALAPIMEAVGVTRPAVYQTSPDGWLFWQQVAAVAPEEMERVLEDAKSQTLELAGQLASLAEDCRAWLAVRADRRPAPPSLLAPLTQPQGVELLRKIFRFFLQALRPAHTELAPLDRLVDGYYDIVHFTGVQSMCFLYYYSIQSFGINTIGWDIDILKRLGIKVVYSNIACFDGVLASTFARHTPEVCSLCNWKDSEYCNDERNANWGNVRNRLADYQITIGGNRDDFNSHPDIHEVPGFYCLDKDVWSPDRYEAENKPSVCDNSDEVVLYHAVGNFDIRSKGLKNIKCTHIYVPLVEQLQREGYPVRLDLVTNVPNKELIPRQLQAHIICDQLTFGWFGANAREGMMLGKPVICFLRPEWLADVAREIPEYVAELPIVSATPQTVEAVLKDLLQNPEKRQELGRRGRLFAKKWHERSAGARQVDAIYRQLLAGNRQLHS